MIDVRLEDASGTSSFYTTRNDTASRPIHIPNQPFDCLGDEVLNITVTQTNLNAEQVNAKQVL